MNSLCEWKSSYSKTLKIKIKKKWNNKQTSKENTFFCFFSFLFAFHNFYYMFFFFFFSGELKLKEKTQIKKN